MVATGLYSISHSRFIRMIALRMAAVPIAAVAAMVAAAAVAAFFDIRWLIVALMAAMIVAPMLAAFLYFKYGMREEGFVNVFPHRLIFSRGLILAETHFPPAKDAADEPDSLQRADEKWERKWNSAADEEKPKETEETDETAPQAEPVKREYRFAVASPMRYSVSGDGITITLEKPHRGLIFVPYSAFASKEDFSRMIETMN